MEYWYTVLSFKRRRENHLKCKGCFPFTLKDVTYCFKVETVILNLHCNNNDNKKKKQKKRHKNTLWRSMELTDKNNQYMLKL